MNKIILKNCDVKEFSSLIKRSASLDNFIFINVHGNKFESTAFNKNVSALKSISSNLENYCESFTNENGEDLVKIQFANAAKLISALSLVGTEGVDVTFHIDETGYAKKVVVKNNDVNLTVPAADKEALAFLEIPDRARFSIFEDVSTLQYKVGISDVEFKYLTQLFGLNKESCRICFCIDGENVNVSEIESTDSNVRATINSFIEDVNLKEFESFEKLYDKKLNYDSFEKNTDGGYLHCFNKAYFGWIDTDEHYDVEFHSNKVKFISVDGKGAKTYVVFTPVAFA